MANNFIGVPQIPQEGLTDWQALLIGAVKEYVELLTGLRGETGNTSKAITEGQITVSLLSDQNMRQVSAKASGFTLTISGTDYVVASLDDYTKLVTDVQSLAADLAETRLTLNTLLLQLKGAN